MVLMVEWGGDQKTAPRNARHHRPTYQPQHSRRQARRKAGRQQAKGGAGVRDRPRKRADCARPALLGRQRAAGGRDKGCTQGQEDGAGLVEAHHGVWWLRARVCACVWARHTHTGTPLQKKNEAAVKRAHSFYLSLPERRRRRDWWATAAPLDRIPARHCLHAHQRTPRACVPHMPPLLPLAGSGGPALAPPPSLAAGRSSSVVIVRCPATGDFGLVISAAGR